ncbi:hypothetical protein K458DRAFT_391126 [Lentithecium fluviatile CBS 122367]|uniref:Uncharacterized protein n=1 Tax=Lentithecium fluviatile CBS 122367 TaxID=1168545 RepID=A0A6G1IV21_9PLEO|nr:hypothetical protein K458DRAFT_391126 [Lentithecium fluviatile CBS 122367]
MRGLPPYAVADFKNEDGWGSDTAVTSSSNSPTFPPFKFNPEARPFIPGALSHPPTPTEENGAPSVKMVGPSGTVFNLKAPPFSPISASPYFPPGMPGTGHRGQQLRPSLEDPFISHFNEVDDIYNQLQGPINTFEDFNSGYGLGITFPFDTGYPYHTPQFFASPPMMPVYATAPNHVYEHSGYGGGNKKKKNKKYLKGKGRNGWNFAAPGGTQQQANEAAFQW